MSNRKLILVILAIFLACAAWDVVGWYASPSATTYAPTGNIRTLSGNNYAETGDLEPFRSALYELSAPLAENASATLTGYSPDYTPSRKTQQLARGTVQFVFNFPLDSYAALDCAISTDADIETICLSDQAAVTIRNRYPVRPLNILLPAAVLSVLLLVCVRVKPVHNALKAVDRKIIDPDTRARGVTVAYMVFAVAALLHHIYVILYFQVVKTGAADLAVPLLVFAAVTFLFGKLWKDRVSWILLALLFLKYARTAFSGQLVLEETSHVYIMAAYAFFGCYGVARAVSKKYWKTFLAAFCACWVLAAVVYASFGIYVASTGTPVRNLGNEWFRIRDDGRMCFTNHPVTSGITLATAMAIALFGFCMTKRKALKVLSALSAVILFLAGSLTGTRTVFLLSGMELALLLSLAAFDRLKPGKPGKAGWTAGKWVALAVLFLAVTVLVAFIQSYACEAFSLVRAKGGLLVTRAAAEAPAPEMYDITRRSFLSEHPEDASAGRLTLWRNLWTVLTSNPRNLLIGQSVYNPVKVINDLRTPQGLYEVYHCHNTFLQTLLENGLPGFLLYLGFTFIFFFHAFRVLKNRDLPFWQRLVPIPAAACFVADLLDSTCHVTYGYPQMTLLFLFAGFTIALGRQAKKEGSAG